MILEAALVCLTQNIYFESRSQSTAGQIAVAQVVMNRVDDERYPDNVCEVVKQGPTYKNWKGNVFPIKHKCQFSWYCDGKTDEMHDEFSFKKAENIASMVLEGFIPDITDGATHYHAVTVFPRWAFSLQKTTVIDEHIFYR